MFRCFPGFGFFFFFSPFFLLVWSEDVKARIVDLVSWVGR